ncbi:phosphotransferase [Trebonia sp.]|uniref:phosphotransferase n=1 Tax=Trebonia sp. TaxID=2767075 RepID=UPI002637C47C|nr:phosphotransferase [Trebonia sp.]
MKHYTSSAARQAAEANYRWLAGLESRLRLPELTAASGPVLWFERIDGRYARPEDLVMLAAHLGDAHGSAYVTDLHQARLNQPYCAGLNHMLPSFPDRRVDAVARELRAGNVSGSGLMSVARAQRLLTEADGPAAFYKDSNPRNFLITPGGLPVTIDFDDLTLAPFGYDLAKLIVTLAMTYGALPRGQIAAALSAYNTAAARQCAALPGVTWAELMNWAEIHHILTSRYAADGRYSRRWHEVGPADGETGARTWP